MLCTRFSLPANFHLQSLDSKAQISHLYIHPHTRAVMHFMNAEENPQQLTDIKIICIQIEQCQDVTIHSTTNNVHTQKKRTANYLLSLQGGCCRRRTHHQHKMWALGDVIIQVLRIKARTHQPNVKIQSQRCTLGCQQHAS